ncbi:hypothetical protein AMTRI_Chr03g50080 [Amborella trichopoda]
MASISGGLPSPPPSLSTCAASGQQQHTAPPFVSARLFASSLSSSSLFLSHHGSNNNNNNGSNNNNNYGDSWSDDNNGIPNTSFCLLLSFSLFPNNLFSLASKPGEVVAWEVKGGKWSPVYADSSKDELFADNALRLLSSGVLDLGKILGSSWLWCRELAVRLMLPEGYPASVSSDYLEYSLWRAVQGVASQINGVLTTQALLYAVGLGKGAIPTAAAVNWVLKDGLGYLSKIFLSKYGRHFDVHPKGWRLFADLLENAAYGLELLTPAYPQFFVLIGAAAGAGRSAAALIQVIAKGEAQGMVSKSIGIMLGIALANHIGASGPLAAASFGVVTAVHMFCNLKSYQSIQLRTLNPYRGKAKEAAAQIESRLQLGCKLSDVVSKKEDVLALFDLFEKEGYILTEQKGKYCVVLKEDYSPQDMLKSLFQVSYLYWLERNAGIDSRSASTDCKPGGKMQLSYDYVQREFNHVKNDSQAAGWITDGLIARPLPCRVRVVKPLLV